jgi:hypothetical protein
MHVYTLNHYKCSLSCILVNYKSHKYVLTDGMKPTTKVRDAILENITATSAEELEQIEQWCIDATETSCKSQDHLLNFDEYRQVNLVQ